MKEERYHELIEELDELFHNQEDKDIDYIIISQKEYDDLWAASEKLLKLEAGGVDNWSGYGFAMTQDLDDE